MDSRRSFIKANILLSFTFWKGNQVFWKKECAILRNNLIHKCLQVWPRLVHKLGVHFIILFLFPYLLIFLRFYVYFFFLFFSPKTKSMHKKGDSLNKIWKLHYVGNEYSVFFQIFTFSRNVLWFRTHTCSVCLQQEE